MTELPEWSNGATLLGKLGDTLVPIAIDANGQLYALLRGLTPGGEAGTIALDEDGQIIAILRGSEGNYVSVDAQGSLVVQARGRQTAGWSEFYSSGELFILSLAEYKGDLYAGTGTAGKVLVHSGGAWSVSYDSTESYIYSLAEYDGKLYAGTGNSGKVYVYDAATWSQSYDSPLTEVWCLVEYDGKLYAGGGPGGKVYVYDGAAWSELYDSSEDYIYCLCEYDGKLYAGSGPNGKVFVYDGAAWSELYDSSEDYIMSLAVYAGKLYAGAGPHGKIFVYDGATWSLSYDSPYGYIYSLAEYEGKLYAGTYSGGRVYEFDGAAWAESYSSGESYIWAMAEHGGALYIGSGTNGKVFVYESKGLDLAVDSDGQIIMVPRGESGNYMLVDSDGYLAAKFKAMFAGSPYDVACDAAGRLKFFLTDNVDQWGQYLEVGNAELASRLIGFPVAYDRRGQVLYWSDFTGGVGPWGITAGGAGSGGLYTTSCLAGSQCMQLSVSAADADNAYMTFCCPLPVVHQSFGFGLAFAFSNLPEFWRLRVRIFDGSDYWMVYIRGQSSNGALLLYNNESGETQIGTWSTILTGLNVWHYIKLVFDIDGGAYKRLIYDGAETDLSAYGLYTDTTLFSFAEFQFGIDGRAANAAQFLIDCPIITTKEP